MIAAKKFPAALGHRVFENVWVWDKKEEGSGDYYYLLSFSPFEEDSFLQASEQHLLSSSELESTQSLVKGTTRGAWKVMPITDNICELALIQTAKVGGNIPKWVSSLKLVSNLLTLERIQKRFRRKDCAVDEVRSIQLYCLLGFVFLLLPVFSSFL